MVEYPRWAHPVTEAWACQAGHAQWPAAVVTTTQVTPTPIQKLLKNGEEFVNEGIDMAIFAHTTRESFHTKHQILANRQAGNDVTPLGHISNAMASTAIRGLLQQLIGVVFNRATFLLKQTNQCFQECGFTHTIATNQADHFPFGNLQVDIPKNVALTVVNIDA